MRRSVHEIVGRSDQNLSSAVDNLPDIHVRFAPTTDYTLTVNDDESSERGALLKVNFNRQGSSINRKIDQFEVNFAFDHRTHNVRLIVSGCTSWKL